MNAPNYGTMVLLVALVDMLAWAFELVERPGRRPDMIPPFRRRCTAPRK